MNFRVTLLLLGAVLVIGVVLLAITLFSDDKTPETDRLTEELAGLKVDDIDTVEIEREDGAKMKLVRSGADKKGWDVVEPYQVPAEPRSVEAIIRALMEAKPVAHSELSGNPASHGLAPPSLSVTLRQGKERASTVNLGNVSVGGAKGVVYVTTSKRARPMAVPRAELDAIFRELKGGVKASEIAVWVPDLRTRSLFPSDPRAGGEDVTFIKLTLPNKGKELALSRSPSGVWKFDAPAGWGDADANGSGIPSSTTFTGVNPLIRAITSLSAFSPADFIENPGDLAPYGLDPGNPDLVRAEVKTRDGRTTVLLIGKREAAAAPPPTAPGMPPHPQMGGKWNVSVQGQPGVTRAAGGDLSGLVSVITDPAPLRDRDIVRRELGQQVDGIDIVIAGQPADRPTKIRHTGLEWKLYGGPGDPQTADRAVVEQLLSVVTAPRGIKDFPPVDPSKPGPASFNNPANFPVGGVTTVYVWVEGFDPAPAPPQPPSAPGQPPPPPPPPGEPVKKGEPVKLEFGRREARPDGDVVYVRRTRPNQPPDEFTLLVKAPGLPPDAPDVVAAVSKTRLDLLDRTLPSFSSAGATKVTVAGQNNYALAKDATADPATLETLWRFTAPDPQKGNIADPGGVNDLLTLLATSQSVFGKFVDEGTDPAKLTEFGLNPPRLRVVVEVTGAPTEKDKERVFEFGKDVPGDPEKVFARVSGKPAVFTLQRRAFETFANPGLRDKVVFRGVPAASVNVVELTGWGGVSLKFEKDAAGVWTAKPPTPPMFAVDSAKVAAFLNQLTRARVRSFEKGPPVPAHGFGDASKSLQVILRWPGGAISLNIGASPDNGGTYFGSSAWLPQTDPVFILDALPFKTYKDSPSGFAK